MMTSRFFLLSILRLRWQRHLLVLQAGHEREGSWPALLQPLDALTG
ncbi:MAG TPA: hypothetical protein VNS62_01190 [Candidatus Udaeobacter sp.]|nr:hypothetical protein [Candidatus Udaeobacter sp.]